MGFVYEVAIRGVFASQPIANIFHVWDGDESETPDDIADIFEDNFLVDCQPHQSDDVRWTHIAVQGLDVGNPVNPINRAISISGTDSASYLSTGAHVWVKLESDDNGFKAGGKLMPGLTETDTTDGKLDAAVLSAWQTIFDDLMTDCVAAGVALCIYRPSLSTPGFPNISIVSSPLVRGLGSNNRRQEVFQA